MSAGKTKNVTKKPKKKTAKKSVSKLNLWIEHFLDKGNVETYFNATASAKAAKYKGKDDNSFACIGYQNYRKLQNKIQEHINDEGLSEDVVRLKLHEGINARETKFFAYQGIVCQTIDIINWTERRKYLELLMKYKGDLTEKVEVKHTHGLSPELREIINEIYQQKDS